VLVPLIFLVITERFLMAQTKYKGIFTSDGIGGGTWKQEGGSGGSSKVTESSFKEDGTLVYTQILFDKKGGVYAVLDGEMSPKFVESSAGKYSGTWDVVKDGANFTFSNYRDGVLVSSGSFKPSVLGFLDTSKYQDVITGTWTDSTPNGGYGSWTVDGSNVKGLYKPSKKGNSVDLYTDINKNGLIDPTDKLVGLAATTNVSTGGSGTWNWSAKGKLGDYFGSNGQDAGNFAFTDKTFLKPGTKWDSVFGYLDTSKYQDVVTGTWADSTLSGGYGSWTVDGSNVRGLYKPSKKGNSVQLYTDINKDGSIDAGDKLVGLAATANVFTGGSGTWNWSGKGKLGDYFGSNGQDAGSFAISDRNFVKNLDLG